MKYLVTGGTGFLGRNLCKTLIHKGHKVISIARSHSSLLEEIGVKQIQGNICDPKIVDLALEGVDGVFHVAGKVGAWGRFKDYHEVNVMGTQTIVRAMENNSIVPLVYTSSPSTVFGKTSLEGVDETTPFPTDYLAHYGLTKRLAEEFVLGENRKIKVVALRPHLIFGKDDTSIIPRILKLYDDGRLKIVGDGENLVDVTHVNSAVNAHITAMEKLVEKDYSISGEAYFISEKEPVKLWPFINTILRKNNRGPIVKKVPYWLAYYAGFALELVYKVSGIYDKEPPMTRFIASQLGTSHYFDHTKAENSFGEYNFKNTEDSLCAL